MAFDKISDSHVHLFQNNSVPLESLEDSFLFCDNGNMHFHWSDCFETCNLVRDQLSHVPALLSDFKNRENSINRLQLIPVWIRTKSKVHQTTMYSLYENYILKQIEPVSGVDPFSNLEISFISGTGPFKVMSINACFNQTIFRNFILVYLLSAKLPQRDYRIRLKSKILIEHGANFAQVELCSLEQLSTHGILISMDAELYAKKLSQGESLRILLNTSVLANVNNKSLSELRSYLSQYAFNLLYSSSKEESLICQANDLKAQASFNFSESKKVFLFVAYDKLQGQKLDSIGHIKEFVNFTKSIVEAYYGHKSLKNAA